MGTSAGALVGSLYCAGYTPREVAAILSRDPPINLLRPSLTPWRGGLLSLDGVVARLRELLPPTFAELEREFAVGVVDASGEHVLIDSGSLPEAVAASAAIPFVFEGVDVPGLPIANPCKDGGCVDRIGLQAWRERRRGASLRSANGSSISSGGGGGALLSPYSRTPSSRGAEAGVPPCIVHLITRSSPFSGFDDPASTGEPLVTVVRSPKSGVNFFSLGEFDADLVAAADRARPALLLQASYAAAPVASAPAPLSPPAGAGASSTTTASPAGPRIKPAGRGASLAPAAGQ